MIRHLRNYVSFTVHDMVERVALCGASEIVPFKAFNDDRVGQITSEVVDTDLWPFVRDEDRCQLCSRERIAQGIET